MRFAWIAALVPALTLAGGRFDILEFAAVGQRVDRSGQADESDALSRAVAAANARTAVGEPACVYIPAGRYRIVSAPPAFLRAGCVIGDGSSQSTLLIDPGFHGDLFAWSEAWFDTTPGPRVSGIAIHGVRTATSEQNALIFYDRNDEVFIDDVEVLDLHGRALAFGMTRHASQAYARESHLHSLRFFRDGAPGVPVVEFNSQGTGTTDASNEIRISQLDIYGSRGPGLIIRNAGSGGVRNITIDSLRIEGTEGGTVPADLMTIGDPMLRGGVNNIRITNAELIDPYKGFAALRLTAPQGAEVPYQITFEGMIGGGQPAGEGLRIDAGRTSTFRLSGVHTIGTNIVIGPHVTEVVIDGGGQEEHWTYRVDPSSSNGISSPARRVGR